jgi:hypothetical protein
MQMKKKSQVVAQQPKREYKQDPSVWHQDYSHNSKSTQQWLNGVNDSSQPLASALQFGGETEMIRVAVDAKVDL